MKFIVSDGTEKKVTLEQAGPDVILRVDGLGIAALRADAGTLAVSKQALEESGLSGVVE